MVHRTIAFGMSDIMCEIDGHDELSKMDEHKDKTPTESSELVLSDRWDLKMQKDLYGTIHGKEYDGGDL